MLRFLEQKNLDLMAFLKKYGVVEECDYYTTYWIGHVAKMINK